MYVFIICFKTDVSFFLVSVISDVQNLTLPLQTGVLLFVWMKFTNFHMFLVWVWKGRILLYTQDRDKKLQTHIPTLPGYHYLMDFKSTTDIKFCPQLI